MHEQPTSASRSRTRRGRRVWLIGVFVALAAIIACVLLAIAYWPAPRSSADERLAEIEAARAVPDSENAARIYDELLQDPNAASILTLCPPFLEPPIFNQVRDEAWLTRDHPELAAWIKEYQHIIDRLLDASRLEKCRFPISIDIDDMSLMRRAAPMRQWGYLTTFAANNDIAEGRIDAAMTKWQCLFRMGDHLSQQPLHVDRLLANSVRESALRSIASFVMESNPTQAQMQSIEAMSLPTTDGGTTDLRETGEIRRLVEEKVMEDWGPLDRLRGRLWRYRFNRAAFGTLKGPDLDRRLRDLCLRATATGRGTLILIATKRYKDATGHWPASLNEIKPPLSQEILTDPLNGGPFVYQPAGDTFRLYSRGRNNVDEGGQWQSEAVDDWPIWPPPRRASNPEPTQKGEGE